MGNRYYKSIYTSELPVTWALSTDKRLRICNGLIIKIKLTWQDYQRGYLVRFQGKLDHAMKGSGTMKLQKLVLERMAPPVPGNGQ